ncbi:hypothetical protein Moror_78 [Moniliophthora roreri MCA 2997]|nr:hypothetical protein Moror_78 [Moniliophthora roreri MCA 2997]KAI3621936.1 hypothetical protein WG66_015420 [Moniliophthora roreri]
MGHTRSQLESLKRADLQKLCKDYGVKANLKTEALIELLLETSKPHTRAAPVQESRRSVSTRVSSRNTAPRISSMIIHDTDDEADEQANNETHSPEEVANGADPQTLEEPPAEPPPLPRTRKAKDTQFRLGVGRPVAAGGGGARAITRSLSVSKSKRGKASRGTIPVEETIPEEAEDQEQATSNYPASIPPTPHLIYNEDQGASANASPVHEDPPSNEVPNITPIHDQDIEKRINDALQPLHQQLQALRAELDQYKALNVELAQLATQVTEMDVWKQKVDILTAEVRELRETASTVNSLKAEMLELRNTLNRQSGHSPVSDIEMASGFITPTNTQQNRLSNPTTGRPCDAPSTLHPGIAPSLLGKRPRDSTVSSITDVVEEGDESRYSEGELARKVLRPNKKKARITPTEGTQSESGPSAQSPAAADDNDDAPHRPGFSVYRGPEPQGASYVDPPPPTTPLPRFYAAASPEESAGPSRIPSTQNAAENHRPFTFNFLPVPPTPHAAAFQMQNFPYPEPPQSPTPGSSVPEIIHSNNGDPMDLFQSFGLSQPRSRTASTSAPSTRTPRQENINFINPTALTRREPDNNDLDFHAGLSPIEDLDSDVSAVKRTMYGTEVESDTRFGDFGVEGVGSGFWTGGGGF